MTNCNARSVEASILSRCDFLRHAVRLIERLWKRPRVASVEALTLTDAGRMRPQIQSRTRDSGATTPEGEVLCLR